VRRSSRTTAWKPSARNGDCGQSVNRLAPEGSSGQNGSRVWRDMEEFDSSGAGVHANWPEGFFARLVDGHLSASQDRGGLVGDASCYLVSARELLRFARPVMKRVAIDRRAADDLAELPDHGHKLAV
jgi:hypothetical protein